ncbi:MAG: hypothetical protein WCK78_13230 [Paludibacter sp.]
MNKKHKIPFCPVCGKDDKVRVLNEYFEQWLCDRCNIRFYFTEHTPPSWKVDPRSMNTQQPIDPAKINFTKAKMNFVNPSRRILIEKHDDKIKLTSNIHSLYELLASKDLLSLIPKSFGDEKGTQSGEIDLDNGTINPVKY